MDRKAAAKAITNLFAQYKAKVDAVDKRVLKAATDGKLYEMFVLSKLVADLVRRGCHLSFHGTSLKFKASPGMLKPNDPHFELVTPDGTKLYLYVDIEFDTLGRQQALGGAAFAPASATTNLRPDNSCRHELDLLLVTKTTGYPNFADVWLAVECKAVANFEKHLIKAALGVRRELSLLQGAQPSRLSQAGASPSVNVAADPASEFWLAFIDPKGANYSQSPAEFGIDLRHFEP